MLVGIRWLIREAERPLSEWLPLSLIISVSMQHHHSPRHVIPESPAWMVDSPFSDARLSNNE